MTKHVLIRHSASERPLRRRLALWFGALGGAVSWIVHFSVLYLLAEVACHTQRFAFTAWGLPGVEVVSYALTLLATLVCLAAIVTAYRNRPAGVTGPTDVPGIPEEETQERFMASVGVVIGVLFLLAIVNSTLSFFFLQSCV